MDFADFFQSNAKFRMTLFNNFLNQTLLKIQDLRVILRVVTQGTTGIPLFQIYHGAVGGSALASPSPILVNTWYHVAVTVDSSGNYNMFINGVSVSTLSAQFLPTAASYSINYLGRSPFAGDGWYDGYMDEFRLWYSSSPL